MSMQQIHMDSSSKLEIESIELEKVKNKYDKDDYFMNVSMIIEDKYKKLRYTTKLQLELKPDETSINISRWGSTTVNLGFGELPCVGEPKIDVILEKKQDMTLEEIEKKLGYKIRIVCSEQSGE